MKSPNILVLDEATVGIDNETKKIIYKFFNKIKSNTTIVLSTHESIEGLDFENVIDFNHEKQK